MNTGSAAAKFPIPVVAIGPGSQAEAVASAEALLAARFAAAAGVRAPTRREFLRRPWAGR